MPVYRLRGGNTIPVSDKKMNQENYQMKLENADSNRRVTSPHQTVSVDFEK